MTENELKILRNAHSRINKETKQILLRKEFYELKYEFLANNDHKKLADLYKAMLSDDELIKLFDLTNTLELEALKWALEHANYLIYPVNYDTGRPFPKYKPQMGD